MAIVNKAYYLEETKLLIKNAIQDHGVKVEDDTKFRDYAKKINMIGLGGGSKVLTTDTKYLKDIIGRELYGLNTTYDELVVEKTGGTLTRRIEYKVITGGTYSWTSYSTGWYTTNAISPALASGALFNNYFAVNGGGGWTNTDGIAYETSSGRILFWLESSHRSKFGSPSYFNSVPLEVAYISKTPVVTNLSTQQCEQILELCTFLNGTTIEIPNAQFSITYTKTDGTIGSAESVDGVIIVEDSIDNGLLSIRILGKATHSHTPTFDNTCHINGVNTMRSIGYADDTNGGGGNFLLTNIHYNENNPPDNIFKYWCKSETPEKIAINGKANVATDFEKMGLSMTYAICANPAVRLKDKIYLFGSGYDASANSNKIQIFDCKNEGFSFDSATAPMTAYGYIGACADDANNCIYIIGGHNGYSQYTQIYKYTPSAHTVEQWGNAGGQGWVQTHNKELFEGYAYCVCAPWSGSRVAYKYNPATKSSATIPQPMQIYNIFQIEDDLYAMSGGKILKLDKGANSFSIVVAEDALIQMSAAQFVEVINNKAYFLYGSALRMWDPISNNVTQLLDCGVSLTSNQWSTSCSYENKIYVFGNSERYSKAIYKFVIQEETSDKSMRIAPGNTELSFGETITLGTSGFYYGQDGLETKVDLLKYNEETNEWEVIV